MEYLNSFWHWFVIIVTIGSILGCWWLLYWTKGVGDEQRDGEGGEDTGHVWDHDIHELNTPLPRWWLWLFNGTIVFALVYLAFYPGLGNFAGTLGWTQENQFEEELAAAQARQDEIFSKFREMTPEQLVANQEAREIGGRLFGNNCAMCHGSDGRGAKGFPNLADDDWLYGGTFEAVMTALENGRNGVMTPLGTVLGETGVNEVVAYVQQLSGQTADPELAEAGEKHFQTICMACHGMDGKGNQMLGAPNLTDDIWLYGGTPADIRYTIVNGRSGVMPAFNQLSEDKRRLLSAYVLGLSQD